MNFKLTVVLLVLVIYVVCSESSTVKKSPALQQYLRRHNAVARGNTKNLKNISPALKHHILRENTEVRKHTRSKSHGSASNSGSTEDDDKCNLKKIYTDLESIIKSLKKLKKNCCKDDEEPETCDDITCDPGEICDVAVVACRPVTCDDIDCSGGTPICDNSQVPPVCIPEDCKDVDDACPGQQEACAPTTGDGPYSCQECSPPCTGPTACRLDENDVLTCMNPCSVVPSVCGENEDCQATAGGNYMCIPFLPS